MAAAKLSKGLAVAESRAGSLVGQSARQKQGKRVTTDGPSANHSTDASIATRLSVALDASRQWIFDRERLTGTSATIGRGPASKLSAAQYLLCHHHCAAIHLLVRNELSSPAYALFRPQFEALVTGTWLQCAATESDIERFERHGAASGLQTKIKRIEASSRNPLPRGTLAQFHARNKDGLDDMTHGGVRQTLSFLKEGAGANDKPSVLWLVKMSTAMSYLSAVGLAALADDESLMLSLHAAFEGVRARLA